MVATIRFKNFGLDHSRSPAGQRSNVNYKNMENVLVTGGAGYIGSHACKALAKAGYSPVAYDNLSIGHSSAVKWGPLVVGDIADQKLVANTIRTFRISSVMHFAASAYIGESISNPRKYFNNNLSKTLKLLDCVADEHIRHFVFSSTCATYGIPKTAPIDETHTQIPINPYGESKLAVEKILHWYGMSYELPWIALRYFNAAGADPEGEIGESHEEETHLIPLALRAAENPHLSLSLFGDDYPTRDGTAVRDFIHVSDLADAHVLALGYLERGGTSRAFNLGTGCGHSVLEVINCIQRITGKSMNVERFPRRVGDPPLLTADASAAKEYLHWVPKCSDLSEIVSSAWNWSKRTSNKSECPMAEPLKFA